MILLPNYYDLNNTKCRGQGLIAAFINGVDTHLFSVAAGPADFLSTYDKGELLTMILQQRTGSCDTYRCRHLQNGRVI
jgi:hypothetical protein